MNVVYAEIICLDETKTRILHFLFNEFQALNVTRKVN